MAKDQIRNHLTQHVLYIISLFKTTTNKQWCRHFMQALELTYQQLVEYIHQIYLLHPVGI